GLRDGREEQAALHLLTHDVGLGIGTHAPAHHAEVAGELLRALHEHRHRADVHRLEQHRDGDAGHERDGPGNDDEHAAPPQDAQQLVEVDRRGVRFGHGLFLFSSSCWRTNTWRTFVASCRVVWMPPRVRPKLELPVALTYTTSPDFTT